MNVDEEQLFDSLDSLTEEGATSPHTYIVCEPAVAIQVEEAYCASPTAKGLMMCVPRLPVVVVRQLGLSTQKRAEKFPVSRTMYPLLYPVPAYKMLFVVSKANACTEFDGEL